MPSLCSLGFPIFFRAHGNSIHKSCTNGQFQLQGLSVVLRYTLCPAAAKVERSSGYATNSEMVVASFWKVINLR